VRSGPLYLLIHSLPNSWKRCSIYLF